MKIFKQLNKKGYKHYYEGTIEELDSMDKDNQHLHSEIMQVVMWLYEKHGIWISVVQNEYLDKFQYTLTQKKSNSWNIVDNDKLFNSPTEAYEAAIKHCLEKII